MSLGEKKKKPVYLAVWAPADFSSLGEVIVEIHMSCYFRWFKAVYYDKSPWNTPNERHCSNKNPNFKYIKYTQCTHPCCLNSIRVLVRYSSNHIFYPQSLWCKNTFCVRWSIFPFSLGGHFNTFWLNPGELKSRQESSYQTGK